MAKEKAKPTRKRKSAAKPKEPGLTPAEQRFVDEMLVEDNATRAYRLVFPNCTYATARREGSNWRANPHIQNEIAAGRRAQQTRTKVAADTVIEEARRLAFSDPLYLFEDDGVTPKPIHKIPPATRRVIASVKVKQERVERRTDRVGFEDVKVTETSKIVEYKFWPKPKGLDKLWAHLGLTQEITPLEALLALLSPELAEQVRAALAGKKP